MRARQRRTGRRVSKSTRLNSSHTLISYAWSSDVCSSDRKSPRLNSSHTLISYAVFCLNKQTHEHQLPPRHDQTSKTLAAARHIQSLAAHSHTVPAGPYWTLRIHDGCRHRFVFLRIRGPPRSTLFPYTALFR